jgi:hypothetical protein
MTPITEYLLALALIIYIGNNSMSAMQMFIYILAAILIYTGRKYALLP